MFDSHSNNVPLLRITIVVSLLSDVHFFFFDFSNSELHWPLSIAVYGKYRTLYNVTQIKI